MFYLSASKARCPLMNVSSASLRKLHLLLIMILCMGISSYSVKLDLRKFQIPSLYPALCPHTEHFWKWLPDLYRTYEQKTNKETKHKVKPHGWERNWVEQTTRYQTLSIRPAVHIILAGRDPASVQKWHWININFGFAFIERLENITILKKRYIQFRWHFHIKALNKSTINLQNFTFLSWKDTCTERACVMLIFCQRNWDWSQHTRCLYLNQ